MKKSPGNTVTEISCSLMRGTNDDPLYLTFIEQVERGNFRLHPAGYEGVSNGCITLPSPSHFAILREALLRTPSIRVSASLNAYGTIQVY